MRQALTCVEWAHPSTRIGYRRQRIVYNVVLLVLGPTAFPRHISPCECGTFDTLVHVSPVIEARV